VVNYKPLREGISENGSKREIFDGKKNCNFWGTEREKKRFLGREGERIYRGVARMRGGLNFSWVTRESKRTKIL